MVAIRSQRVNGRTRFSAQSVRPLQEYRAPNRTLPPQRADTRRRTQATRNPLPRILRWATQRQVHLRDRQLTRRSAFQPRDESAAIARCRSRHDHFLRQAFRPMAVSQILALADHAVSIWRPLRRRRVPRTVWQSWPVYYFCDSPRPARGAASTFDGECPRRDLRYFRLNGSPREYSNRVPKMLWPVRRQTNIVPGSRHRSRNRNSPPDQAAPE